MRDYILLFINGRRYEVRGGDVFLTLSCFLRQSLGLCGTKIVCSEGDCGSCSVLVSRIDSSERGGYVSIDSCIRFVFQLDGTHIVTVEGLSDPDSDARAEDSAGLNAVQQAMVECHGSQCGFCTPGFVVTMTGLLQNGKSLSAEQWRAGLTGNLCRCTGYTPIIEAGLRAQDRGKDQEKDCTTITLDEIYPPSKMVAAVAKVRGDSISIRNDREQLQVFCPLGLDEALGLLAQYPDAQIVAGATDIGVQHNKGVCQAKVWLDLNRVEEIKGVSLQENTLIAGARATWSEIETACAGHIPEFIKIVSVFGSPQIRNVGTLGGNIINSSPVADSLPLLLVCNAQLTLASVDGNRTVGINEFYRGRKELDLRSGELLVRITIPLPPDPVRLRLYKVARRRDLDISIFTAAIAIETRVGERGSPEHGSQTGLEIRTAKIAFGAVGPAVVRLPRTEQFLQGKIMSEDTMKRAGDIAVTEISPISDVRGSDGYRNQLARNVLLKYFHQSQHQLTSRV